MSPALTSRFFTTEPPEKPLFWWLYFSVLKFVSSGIPWWSSGSDSVLSPPGAGFDLCSRDEDLARCTEGQKKIVSSWCFLFLYWDFLVIQEYLPLLVAVFSKFFFLIEVWLNCWNIFTVAALKPLSINSSNCMISALMYVDFFCELTLLIWCISLSLSPPGILFLASQDRTRELSFSCYSYFPVSVLTSGFRLPCI